jgi:hypothetical protein
MVDTSIPTIQEEFASVSIDAEGVDPDIVKQITWDELYLGESLLTPGLQTSMSFQSYHHYISNGKIKDLDQFKNKVGNIKITRPILEKYNLPSEMEVRQIIYRLDNRDLYNNNNETFNFHMCDQTLLNDAATLVSKQWNCTTPSAIVEEVLTTCVGAPRRDIESSMPARDYRAENIHPFQVVSQQAQAALDKTDEPSFVHYMTYEEFGTHHFRSLQSLCDQSPVMEYLFAEIGTKNGYGNPHAIRSLSFPCDFDLLSDVLNGINTNGQSLNTLFTFNPVTKSFNQFGSNVNGCGLGAGVVKLALSNMNSAKQQNACPDFTHLYFQKRQARMGLLEKDKISLKIVVPWNPKLHAGKIIRLNLLNKNEPTKLNYGSGDYLIVNMVHNIKNGGYAVTTMDCVSKTVGQGIV